MSSAARMALLRERRRSGRMVLRIEVDVAVSEGLVEAGLLSAADCEDRHAIERCVERLLAALVADPGDA